MTRPSLSHSYPLTVWPEHSPEHTSIRHTHPVCDTKFYATSGQRMLSCLYLSEPFDTGVLLLNFSTPCM
jgi:hypothetical protein